MVRRFEEPDVAIAAPLEQNSVGISFPALAANFNCWAPAEIIKTNDLSSSTLELSPGRFDLHVFAHHESLFLTADTNRS